eukprot:GHVU01226948.1.p1 GENE.GHVU01226948.1~~GHVU01226948.1.p1  ORF type:complete len:115 (-),score=5.59 GHVU01226948.1:30-374(-)
MHGFLSCWFMSAEASHVQFPIFAGLDELSFEVREQQHRFSDTSFSSHRACAPYPSPSVPWAVKGASVRFVNEQSEHSKVENPNVVPVRMIIPYAEPLTAEVVTAAATLAGRYNA